jgi:hypothetical protein
MEQANEIKTKWHAIYIALLNYFNPDDAADAANIWLNKFSDKPAFELQGFITEISNKYNLSVSRKEIQQSIIKLLLMDKNEFQAENMTDSAITSKISSAKNQPVHIIFTKLILLWLYEVNVINPSAAASIRQYMYDSLANIEEGFDQVINLKRWINSQGSTSYIEHLNIEQLRKIFHFCYVGSCQHLGPVSTDKLVVEIAQSLDQTPEGIEFPTKNFF